MNKLSSNLHKGTIGEILVQLKLLTYNIESFSPLKDTGNDLIAYFGTSFVAIQVKTKQDGAGWKVPDDRIYHILAFVDLDENLSLDNTRVYLLTKSEALEVANYIRAGDLPPKFLLNERRILELIDMDRQHALSILTEKDNKENRERLQESVRYLK